MKYVVAIFLVAVGVVGIIAGGADDSPGLQLLSVVLILSTVVLTVRAARRGRTGTRRT